MIPVITHPSLNWLRAPLVCGALLLLGGRGLALGEPTSDMPAAALPEPAPIHTTIVPEITLSFPVLVIEDITPPTETTEPSPEATPGTLPTALPPEPDPVPPPRPTPVEVIDHSGILSAARQFALGMIETGNKDHLIGGLGEVSRYQIMPSVWKVYSESHRYQDTNTATEVARQHWTSLYDYFKKKTTREPTNFDMYVLWNTRFGYYAARGFEPARLHPVVRDRAERFANLVEDSQRRASELEMAAVR